MEYSLDDPKHIVARQQSGTLSRDAEHVDSSKKGVRASYSTDGPHRGEAAYLSAARLASYIHACNQDSGHAATLQPANVAETGGIFA